MSKLTAPHGGALVDRLVAEEARAPLIRQAATLPSWTLSKRQQCDVELILNGAFSPLEGFLGESDYETVLAGMRLGSGLLWPIPVTLDVSDEFAREATGSASIALRDPEGFLIAVLDVSHEFRADAATEAEAVFGTADPDHAGVRHLLDGVGAIRFGGSLRGASLPLHYDFRHLRHTPAELRTHFSKLGWTRIVAFQTRNPIHRAHQELTFRAARVAEANLLLHPVVGQTKSGDVDHFTRVRCYERILHRYPAQTTALSLLPLAMRMAGPREALWHAIIRKNFGCSHFIVGRDHAGPGGTSDGVAWYAPYEAQQLAVASQSELGIEILPSEEMVYVAERAAHVPRSRAREGDTVLSLSGTELRRRLELGLPIPDWFTWPEVAEELRRTHPPRHRQGFTVFFTGLSGAGKSTIANGLQVKLLELGDRPVTLLDGDIVRKNLSSELGFSREHRDLNVRRIGFVASEITKNGGVAICAPIAPYAEAREEVRALIGRFGPFLEVHVSTPLEVCEGRDRKGLYSLARSGKLAAFTGISDPYEVPANPELRIDTTDTAPEEAIGRVLLTLEALGLIRSAQ